MNSYYPLALLLARQEAAQSALETANSALPHAPVVPVHEGSSHPWLDALRGRVATILHRVAWALEPEDHIGIDH
ncbi:hypothetical protein AB4Y77_14830 [Paenarthrobacter sp. YAF11_1]|uniref:Uncharacterized protein n=1 Tax=Arthrobacter bambusae TaxID=1338426 RepID=A0ABV2P1R5_9MICC|nr:MULTISPECIES: hypothetical protein [Micrococcaceae]MCD4852053.1 hypothetical protein [Arthrobacter sp. AK01]MCP1413726.1 hypothetical protein [Paenarthrobacter sp. A20]